jgi:hypothetical protein
MLAAPHERQAAPAWRGGDLLGNLARATGSPW